MKRKLYWGLAALIILVLAGFAYMLAMQYAKIQQLKKGIAESDKVRQESEKPESSEGTEGDLDPSHPDFHIHEDGTPHIGKHDAPKVQYTAPAGAVTKPVFPTVDPTADPVKAAYERLEYIKNNPYAWGGVHSPRATELIAKLMSASGPIRLIDHEHGDQVIELIEELCEQGDPRAAEVLIAHMCDGDTVGRPMVDALEEIGPPAVPYLLPYLEKFVAQGGTTSIGMFDALGRIGARYRADLGGIVQYVIIPKLKVIAADKDNERYDSGSVIDASEALAKLQ